jgi:hypothetical protein
LKEKAVRCRTVFSFIHVASLQTARECFLRLSSFCSWFARRAAQVGRTSFYLAKVSLRSKALEGVSFGCHPSAPDAFGVRFAQLENLASTQTQRIFSRA